MTYFPRSNTRKWCAYLVNAVSGKPLGGIGRNLYHALFGVFSVAHSFSGAFRDFDLLSKVKYTKMVLVSCGPGTARRNWPKFIPRVLWAVFWS